MEEGNVSNFIKSLESLSNLIFGNFRGGELEKTRSVFFSCLGFGGTPHFIVYLMLCACLALKCVGI